MQNEAAELDRATAYLALCRRTIRSYISRMKNGESRMNLSWEMAPEWKDYRYMVRRVLKLRGVA